MIQERTLTYDELETMLRKSPKAVRQLVRRREWRRIPGNDGRTRIVVPVEALDEELAGVGDHGPGTDPHEDAAPVPVLTLADPLQGDHVPHHAYEVLARHIKRLEAELVAMREERDKAQHERDEARSEAIEADKAQAALAAQLDALNAVLAVERRRADERAAAERERAEEWKAVADRFAIQAEKLTAAAEARRSWWPWRRAS